MEESEQRMKGKTNGQPDEKRKEYHYSGFIGWLIASSWLAYWQLRQSWRMLLFMGLITMSAIVIVCSIPLFSSLALEASLHDTFDAHIHPFSNILRIGGDTTTPTTDQLKYSGNDISSVLQRAVNAPLSIPDVTISSWNYLVYRSDPTRSTVTPLIAHFVSLPDAQLHNHLVLTSGTLPAQRADGSLELVIPSATASAWHAGIGATVFVEIPPERQIAHGDSRPIPAHIVGIGEPSQNDVLFGYDNANSATLAAAAVQNYTIYGNFAAIFALTKQEKAQAIDANGAFSYYWTYTMDTSRLQLDQIDALASQGNALTTLLQNAAPDYDNLSNAYIDENGFFATVDALQSSIIVFQTPTSIVIMEMLGFIIFFISVIGEYIVAWQSDIITILRSRGMEQGQIISAFSLQLLLLGAIALAAGPVVAVVLVQHIANIFFFQSTITISPQDLIAQTWNVAGYAAIAAGAITFAMILAIARATNQNILVARRELARETRMPLWRKMYLDVGLGILGIAGFAAYYQVGQNLGEYVVHTNQYLMVFSVLSPLIFAAACTLLFFRVFPFLLRIVARLASVYRGASPVIALARLARTPRQATQTALLLALFISIASFTIVTMATQQQRVADVAAYAVGADFRGTLPRNVSASPGVVANQYNAIQGVENASAGASFNVVYASSDTGLTLTLQAMDGDAFARTAYWGDTYSQTSLASLMQEASAQRAQAAQRDAVPAIVDAATWNALGLTTGAPFALSLPGYADHAMQFTAIAKVNHLPAIFDTAGLYNQGNAVDGGILVDYQTFQSVYTHDVPGSMLNLNTVWLRTQADPQVISRVRAQLSAGPLKLEQLQDRAALVSRYRQDPLQNDLLFAQAVVAIAAFILAGIGLIIAAGFNAAQQRVASVILQALGAGKSHMRMVAIWEQILVYGFGVLLGIFLSGILIWLVAPMLAFVQLFNSNGTNSILALDVPPVRMIIPVNILAAATGIVLALSLGAIIIMTGQTARKPLSQTLRLNQD